MAQAEQRLSDERMEEFLGNVLRIGVIIAGAVVLAGGLVYLAKYGSVAPNYRFFRGEPEDLRTVTGIVQDALLLRGRGLIQFGLLLLIATPIARVMFALLGFARQRDLIYVIVALIVLAVLAYSLAGGHV
jgi:uncharacterized membrane protein